jgi:DegV family protein with EDD domain
MSVRIVTDSTCDLAQETVDSLGITVIPLHIQMGDRSYLDGVDITREEFYRWLPEFDPPPTTAAPGPEAMVAVYDALAAAGASQVLSIHISSSLSAVPDVARVAAGQTISVPVTVLDSRQLSLGTGFLVETAAREARRGASLPAILSKLEEQISRTHVFAALATMEFLRRSGRVNTPMAGIGSLLQVKPILKMYQGNSTSERVRTTRGAERRLLELLSERFPLERIALVHTHADDKARVLLARVAEELPPGEVPSVDITPVIGAHIGPGAVGFALIQAAKP